MKKLLSFILILMVCCSSALLFAGCDRNTTFLFVTDISDEESVSKEYDDLGREIYTFTFNKFTGDEIDRRAYEKKQLEKIQVKVFKSMEEAGFVKGTSSTPSPAEGVEVKVIKASEMTIANFSLKTTTGSTPRTATVSYDGATATFLYIVE